MKYNHARDEHMACAKHVNNYFPDIERFHKNEILLFFDSLNTDYLVNRKIKFNKINTKSEAMAYIDEVRNSFKSCLGELPGESAVNAVVVSTTDKGNYFIDNVLIETMPGYFLSANFYYPRGATRPSPSVLFLCGHSVDGKAAFTYVSFCVEAVLNGFCVLTFDPVGQGERKMYDARDSAIITGMQVDTVHYLLGQQMRLIGDSITAYMMWDNIKALDYLCSRKEADSNAISVAGNSGGGQMAAFMGAYDSRISVVISSCYITELKSMIYNIGAQECEQSMQDFMKNGLDLADLVIAAAPKPYFIGAALMDFFPIDGTRDAFIDARKIYRLFEKEDNINIYIAPKPHGFWWDTREKALRFLCRHSGKEFVENKEIDYDNLPSEQELLCLEKGDINYYNTDSLQKLLQRKAEKLYPEPPAINDAAGLEAYAGTVRTNLLRVLKIDFNDVKADIDKVTRSYDKECNIMMTEFSFYSEEYMKVYGSLFEREQGVKSSVLLHIGRLDMKDKLLNAYLDEFSAVFCVETRGNGKGAVETGCFFYVPSHFENEEASYNCNAAMLGRNVAGMRTADALGAVKLIKGIKELDNCCMTIGGDGENALTALYTAVALGGRDVRLTNLLYSFKCIIDNRMYMWGPSVFVYDILRYFDVPELLTALMTNNIRIEGFLDNMKEKADNEQLRNISGRLRELSIMVGHYFEVS